MGECDPTGLSSYEVELANAVDTRRVAMVTDVYVSTRGGIERAKPNFIRIMSRLSEFKSPTIPVFFPRRRRIKEVT